MNCVPPPDGLIRYWSPPSPPSSESVAELLRLDSWYFELLFGLGVYSSLASTLFFHLPFFFMVFCFRLAMCVTNSFIGSFNKRCFVCYFLQGSYIIMFCDYPARHGGVTLGMSKAWLPHNLILQHQINDMSKTWLPHNPILLTHQLACLLIIWSIVSYDLNYMFLV
jgi:hypothetical protein